MFGSFFSYGDHEPQRLKSLMSGKILSGGALMLVARCTRNVSGLKAAKMRTAASRRITAMAIVLIISQPFFR
jgi:uncharacterized protein YoaH (UPF0181 family)